jgi:predicted enzyme related to lactoylglutathione lyase
MGRAVVHFEIIGPDPERLRAFYGELFDWNFDLSARVSSAVSEPEGYGFVEPDPTDGDAGIPGGVGGGSAYQSRVRLYVGVEDVEEALRTAESLGGTRVLGPDRARSGLVIGLFVDPQGNEIGVAGPQ